MPVDIKLETEAIEDMAELAGGYKDDFGKWIFRDVDDLFRFEDLILAKSGVQNLRSMVEILKTDLAAAELEIKNLRSL